MADPNGKGPGWDALGLSWQGKRTESVRSRNENGWRSQTGPRDLSIGARAELGLAALDAALGCVATMVGPDDEAVHGDRGVGCSHERSRRSHGQAGDLGEARDFLHGSAIGGARNEL